MPGIEMIGAYPIDVTEALFKEAYDMKYDGGVGLTSAEEAETRALVREELTGVVLVELLVHDVDEACNISDFGQTDGNELGASDQVAYAEVLLNDDGTRLLSEPFDNIDFDALRGQTARIAFFLHFYDPERPILTSYGPIPAPPRTPMPERLRKIISYEPVD
jgi:hypothetical protein